MMSLWNMAMMASALAVVLVVVDLATDPRECLTRWVNQLNPWSI